MLALIFAIQSTGLILVLRGRKPAAVGCFWLSLLLTLLWFEHHATDALGLSL